MYSEVFTINIAYRTKKLEKICNNSNEAKKELGDRAGKKLIQRIRELKAFENLNKVPSSLPWRREKLTGFEDMWSVRVDSNYRIEFKAIDLNEDLRLIEQIKIMEVSKHYG